MLALNILVYNISRIVVVVVVVVVDCGLTSHSAIFQLYCDETDVQFLKNLLQGQCVEAYTILSF